MLGCWSHREMVLEGWLVEKRVLVAERIGGEELNIIGC